jgi:hypothetical protein
VKLDCGYKLADATAGVLAREQGCFFTKGDSGGIDADTPLERLSERDDICGWTPRGKLLKVIVWEADGNTSTIYYLDTADRLGMTLPSPMKNRNQGYLLWDGVPAEIEDDEAEQGAGEKVKAAMADED